RDELFRIHHDGGLVADVVQVPPDAQTRLPVAQVEVPAASGGRLRDDQVRDGDRQLEGAVDDGDGIDELRPARLAQQEHGLPAVTGGGVPRKAVQAVEPAEHAYPAALGPDLLHLGVRLHSVFSGM